MRAARSALCTVHADKFGHAKASSSTCALRLRLLAVALLCAALPLPAIAQLAIVRDGQPAAAVVVAPDAVAQVRSAAELLISYLEQSTGATLPLSTDAQPGTVTIYIGDSAAVQAFAIDQDGLDADGFDLAFPAENTIVILGPSPWGTEFGVYEFLERYVGVRWLIPGPAGTDVPKHRSLIIPAAPVRQSPVFFSRQMSGFRGSAQSEWARRNRMHGRVSFHHNLRRLFQWEKYLETNPEFYPLVGGKRYRPHREEGWQPCFTVEGIIEEGAKNIIEFFDKNPGATSYSLGINDNRNYCQCPTCTEKMSGENNFLGIADYSDMYYEWCNQVVEKVLAKHPDKYFGLLAYSNVAAPPRNVQVHPRIIPYMTYDRMKWIHPELRAEGEEMTRQWRAKSPTLGWYDYIYGRPYMLPRVWFHHMAEYYRFGHANGVQVQYAEAYPNWGEGPKLYVSLKLQWDPFQDVSTLLDEWCMRMGGEAAGPSIRQYYSFWEDFWTRRILDSPWFRLAGQYLPHRRDPAYLMEVTEAELAQCRDWLEDALAVTQTEEQRTRVQILLDAYSFYEASALVYQAGSAPPPTSEQEALTSLDRVVRAFAMGERRNQLANVEFAASPVLQNVGEALLFENDRGLIQTLWAVYAWVAENEATQGPVMRRFRELSAHHEADPMGRILAMAVSIHEQPERMVERINNGGFEQTAKPRGEDAQDPQGPDWVATDMPPHWNKWIRPGTTAEVLWTDEEAHSGRRSIRITGATASSVLQSIEVRPDDTFMLSAMVKARINANGYTRLAVQWQDADRKWVRQPSVIQQLPPGETDGWVKRFCLFRAPEGVARAVIGLSAGGQQEGDYAYFDDVTVKQVVPD